jgi:hypothetical protein
VDGTQVDSRLLMAAASLATVTGALHLYFAFVFFPAEPGLMYAFIGIGIVDFVGAGAAFARFKLPLVLKGGLVWMILMIITWAGGAAAGRGPNLEPISFADKGIEVLCIILIVLMMRRQKAAGPEPPKAA